MTDPRTEPPGDPATVDSTPEPAPERERGTSQSSESQSHTSQSTETTSTEPDDADAAAEAAARNDALAGTLRTVGATGMVLTVVALVGFDAQTAIGVALGGLLATANLALFARLGRAFLDTRGGGMGWGLLGAIKLIGLFTAVWLLLRRGDVPALALVVGYGSLPIGIVLSGLRRPAR
jgi:hypothetical protein